MLDIEIIPATPVHHDFIYATWLKSFRYASYFAKRIKNEVYFKGQHARIDRVLANPKTKMLVAIEPPDHEFMVGYLVYTETEPAVIHYIYVKENLRKLGVAKALLTKSGVNVDNAQFTHWTYDCDWVTRKVAGLVYNPYF